MPRAFHVDAELETFAYRARLTERETPRSGFRTTRTPHPLPNFANHCCCALGRCCSLLPFCRLLQRFS